MILEQGDFFVSGAATNDPHSHYFRRQIIQTTKRLNYCANQSIYRAWVCLALRNTNVTEVLIAFHGIGLEFQGVLACSASRFQRLETAEGEREVGPATPMTDSVFLINYKGPLDQAKKRFLDWLEDAIVRSLKLWQETVL